MVGENESGEGRTDTEDQSGKASKTSVDDVMKEVADLKAAASEAVESAQRTIELSEKAAESAQRTIEFSEKAAIEANKRSQKTFTIMSVVAGLILTAMALLTTQYFSVVSASADIKTTLSADIKDLASDLKVHTNAMTQFATTTTDLLTAQKSELATIDQNLKDLKTDVSTGRTRRDEDIETFKSELARISWGLVRTGSREDVGVFVAFPLKGSTCYIPFDADAKRVVSTASLNDLKGQKFTLSPSPIDLGVTCYYASRKSVSGDTNHLKIEEWLLPTILPASASSD